MVSGQLLAWRRKFNWWKPKCILAVGAEDEIPQNYENRSIKRSSVVLLEKVISWCQPS